MYFTIKWADASFSVWTGDGSIVLKCRYSYNSHSVSVCSEVSVKHTSMMFPLHIFYTAVSVWCCTWFVVHGLLISGWDMSSVTFSCCNCIPYSAGGVCPGCSGPPSSFSSSLLWHWPWTHAVTSILSVCMDCMQLMSLRPLAAAQTIHCWKWRSTTRMRPAGQRD